jgi:hypothetical protein
MGVNTRARLVMSGVLSNVFFLAALTQRDKGAKARRNFFYREIMENTEIIFLKNLHELHDLPVKKFFLDT